MTEEPEPDPEPEPDEPPPEPTDDTPLVWIDIPTAFNLIGQVEHSQVFGKTFVRPGLHRTKSLIFSVFNPLVTSLRFWQSEWRFFAAFEFRMARRLAYIMWRINAMQRWLGLEPTEFEMRDRVTEEKFTIETDPEELEWEPTGNWWTTANLDALLTLIEDQIRQSRGGGPSGKGARHGFEHELLEQAREALPDIIDRVWNAPPAGPGFGGAMFGARWTMLKRDGTRPDFSQAGEHETRPLCYGAKFPEEPDSTTAVDTLSWDYAASEEDEEPPQAEHYLPIEKLKPGEDWNKDHFEAMRFIGGTGTSNASRYPPDIQLLSEFSLVTGDMPQLRHAIRTLTNMPAVPLDPPEILMPPEGSGLANQNYWVNDRAGSKAQGAADTAGNYHFYEWFWGNPNLGLGFFVPPFVHANAGYRIVGQGAGKHLEGGALNRGWNRHGWETDIMGTPFKLSYWDWFCLKFGAVPNEIRVVGRLVLDQTPIRPPPDNNRSYSLTSAALGWKQGTSDEEIARAVMPFDVTDFDEIAGIDETDAVSEVVDVDEDFSDVLKATYPSDGALCFGMNIQFQVVEVPNGAVQIFAGCRFDGGAISVGGRLEAVFDGQRVILAEV